MLTLIQYPAAFNSSSASPFCTKVELLLKMANLDYVIEDLADARKMPHQKLPVLRDGEKLVVDSVGIRDYLEQQHGANFDQHLSAEEVAVAHAFTRLCEERLYWVLLYSRWMNESNWLVVKEHFFGGIPWPGRVIVPAIVRKQVKKTLNGQGIGRHPENTVYNFGIEDLQSLETWLGDKPYLMGETISSVDATVYAFVAAILFAPFPSPMKEALEKMGALVAYATRLKKYFFEVSHP